jgi:hypothetical protein
VWPECRISMVHSVDMVTALRAELLAAGSAAAQRKQCSATWAPHTHTAQMLSKHEGERALDEGCLTSTHLPEAAHGAAVDGRLASSG